MDQLTKVEVIAAGGALIISTGSFWYLNGKLTENTEQLSLLTTKFSHIIAKIHQQEEDIKINKAKSIDIDQLRSIQSELDTINSNFTELSEEISTELQSIAEKVQKQERKMSLLDKKVNALCDQLGIDNVTESDTIEEIESNKKPKKKKKSLVIKPSPIKQKEVPKKIELPNRKPKLDITDYNEEDVLKEMEMIIPNR